MTQIIGNVRDLRGIDYAHAKWEFDNKMPSHIFSVVYFENDYIEAAKYAINAIDRERKMNDQFLLEMDYTTGDIRRRVKTMDELVHYREEPFHKFIRFFTKTRGFKNKSITINFCDKYRYIAFVLNHSFADGLQMYNSVMATILIGSRRETISKDYVYRPFINEALMAKSILNHAKLTLTTNASFVYNERVKTITHYLNIDNKIITQIKNELNTSFNFVCMAFVLKYMFDNSDATSLNVLVSYGFKANDAYYNNYTFVIITVQKEDCFVEMVKKIASDIDQLKTDFVGSYELTHNYSGLEKIVQNNVIDVVYASLLLNIDRHHSVWFLSAEPSMPVYVGVSNSKANTHTNVAISTKTKNVFLKNNDSMTPKLLKTSNYITFP